jgi:hypothetical protein
VVKPNPEKVRAILEVPRPSTKSEVRSLLGLIGYYRTFIPDFAKICEPLTDLTKKGKSLEWTSDCENSFRVVKEMLAEAPILKTPDFKKIFILQTDASAKAISAVLSQQDDDDKEHPVCYISRKLLQREMHYPIIEKECLAIVWGVTKLHHYLAFREFIIETDHQPLIWLDRVKNTNQKLLRWSLLLQQYAYSIRHRSGKKNSNADFFSRT